MAYQYTLLKQDGTRTDLGTSPKRREFAELYKALECRTVEIIPKDYYPAEFKTRTTIYGDEEGRFNSENGRNPHMLEPLPGWYCVGDLVAEYHIKK